MPADRDGAGRGMDRGFTGPMAVEIPIGAVMTGIGPVFPVPLVGTGGLPAGGGGIGCPEPIKGAVAASCRDGIKRISGGIAISNAAANFVVPLRLERGLREPKTLVLTITPWNKLLRLHRLRCGCKSTNFFLIAQIFSIVFRLRRLRGGRSGACGGDISLPSLVLGPLSRRSAQ